MRQKIFLLAGLLLLAVGWILGTERFRLFSSQGVIEPKSLTGEFDRSGKLAIFEGRTVALPQLAETEDVTAVVLGESNTQKRIEVDLTNQRVYAFEGDRMVYNFLISSGKWGKTPTGSFRIWAKMRYTKMEGGSKLLHTYYYLPNVPYVMFFTGDGAPRWRGFGLHGTYWHNNFGHTMSHGCINMKTEEAGILYNWAMPDLRGERSIMATEDNPGTPILIYGTAPED